MATDITTTMSAPWTVQQPYLEEGFKRANQLYAQGGPQYFPNSTVAPLSQTTQNALSGIESMGMNNPYLNQANSYYSDTMQGKYLNANPYLDGMYDNAARAVTRNFTEGALPGVSAKFGMSGRSGSPGMMNAVQGAYDALGQNLTGMASNIYGQNYAQERQNQQQAFQFAPNLAQANFGSMTNALDAGQIRDTQAQKVLSDDVARFQFNQQRPYQNLSTYLGNVGGGYGTSSQTATPAYETPWWQYALGGAGLLSSMF